MRIHLINVNIKSVIYINFKLVLLKMTKYVDDVLSHGFVNWVQLFVSEFFRIN